MKNRDMTMTLTLCQTCRNSFDLIPGRELLLVQQRTLDKCVYCNVRYGFDYLLVDKTRKNKQASI
ncbi:MAG: hypothetical protein LBC82_09250 [Oscillospiraceae bacterium]|jgi:hypothetical protein|nr:hypothetical protein [Oscillospiraceae bacterium]